MSQDLLKQAELRHQRRPKSRQTEEILTLDVSKQKNSTLLIGDKLPVDGSSLPPIRHFGNYDRSPTRNSTLGNADSPGALNSTSPLSSIDRPKTPQRRIAPHKDRLDVEPADKISEHDCQQIILPFIKCKLNEKPVKALISTVSERSTISHRLLEGVRWKNDRVAKAIEISGDEFLVNFSIDDSAIHDLVLGLDFVYENQCVLDFSTKDVQFKGKDGTKTPLLTHDDLPLKFRNTTRKGLASSI